MNFLKNIAISAVIGLAVGGHALANEFEAQILAYADSDIRGWLAESVIIDAIKAQNADHASLSQDDIDKMDQTWRAEVGQATQPMIKKVMDTPLSKFLMEKREAAGGVITEIFVMDNKGLNVGQSDVTSDYWQGDEAKWQETFSAGAEAVHISDVEQDDSTQAFQSQLSLPITDPANNSVIGAVTIGLNVELLP